MGLYAVLDEIVMSFDMVSNIMFYCQIVYPVQSYHSSH